MIELLYRGVCGGGEDDETENNGQEEVATRRCHHFWILDWLGQYVVVW